MFRNLSRYACAAVMCMLTVFILVSCEDVRDFADFLLPENADDIYENLEPGSEAEPSEQMVGILITAYHTDTVDGEYTGTVSDMTAGYIEVGDLVGTNIYSVSYELDSMGIPYTVTKSLNPTSAGTVYAAEYAGFRTGHGSDGSSAESSAEESAAVSQTGYVWYINPAYTVNLYVSADKPELPEGTEENTIYITFDDGPSGEGTKKIVDILDTYGIHATFFTVGKQIEKYPEMAKLIYDHGNVIACHSMSHDYDSLYASEENFISELDSWVSLVNSLGIDYSSHQHIFRFPGGSSNSKIGDLLPAFTEALEERGFEYYDWNIVANDALLFQCPDDMTTSEYIMENFTSTYQTSKNLDGKKILLLHEGVDETVNMLGWIIEYLITDGCTFDVLG